LTTEFRKASLKWGDDGEARYKQGEGSFKNGNKGKEAASKEVEDEKESPI